MPASRSMQSRWACAILRLIIGAFDEMMSGEDSTRHLLERMRTELRSVQAAARQIVDTQQDLVDAIRLEVDDTCPTPRTARSDDIINRVVRTNRLLAASVTLHGAPSRLALVADCHSSETRQEPDLNPASLCASSCGRMKSQLSKTILDTYLGAEAVENNFVIR